MYVIWNQIKINFKNYVKQNYYEANTKDILTFYNSQENIFNEFKSCKKFFLGKNSA